MNPFLRKLGHGARLSEEDHGILSSAIPSGHRIDANSDIVLQGDRPRALILVLEGWACRYRLLESGKRQIISLFLPGDLCEPFGTLPRFMDHSLASLTPVVAANVSPDDLRDAAQRSVGIEEALWWDMLTALSAQHERIVSLGRRSAVERMGHLFCELHLRLGLVGLADGARCPLPITQADLGDLLGLSAVHVNRSLQELRSMGLVSLRRRNLTILDLEGLRAVSDFDPNYFHLDRPGAN